MVYHVIFHNERTKEICSLREPLGHAVGLTPRANKRYVSSKVTSKCEDSCFI